MHVIWELEVLRKEFFVCLKIFIIDETIFFSRKVFSKRFAPLYFFFNPLYSFTFLVWDGLNNAFDYWPIVVDDTCKYCVFEEVRIVKFFNPFVTQGKSVVYLEKIWRDMHLNVPCTRIYAIRPMRTIPKSMQLGN